MPPHAQIELVHNGTEGLVLLGNREQVAVAVGNLVANAVAYSPEGSSVVVGATGHDTAVDITVTDRGIGIPAHELDRIFERFYRVDPARHRSTGGTGLGLSIVKHVAASHGGEVRVWSVEGQGSTFTLTLPRKPGSRCPARPPTPDSHPRPHVSTTRGDRVTRVLVVEDEESYSDALAYMLRKEGFEVAIAATGPDALAEFDRAGADIVLLDLMLPGMPGTEVCRQIRQTSNVPVIMVSAKDDEVDKVVGLELGADDYVTKPYSPRELVARIRAVLRRGVEPDLAPLTLEVGSVRMDVERHIVTVGGDGGPAAAQGVRAARDVPAQPRPGAHPRPADRPGVGLRLRRRHQDPRRARQAAARQARGQPGRAEAAHHGARAGLQARPLSRPAAGARLDLDVRRPKTACSLSVPVPRLECVTREDRTLLAAARRRVLHAGVLGVGVRGHPSPRPRLLPRRALAGPAARRRRLPGRGGAVPRRAATQPARLGLDRRDRGAVVRRSTTSRSTRASARSTPAPPRC